MVQTSIPAPFSKCIARLALIARSAAREVFASSAGVAIVRQTGNTRDPYPSLMRFSNSCSSPGPFATPSFAGFAELCLRAADCACHIHEMNAIAGGTRLIDWHRCWAVAESEDTEGAAQPV